MRALFAKENPGPYIIWGTGQEPTYLHFSILLFIAGSLIYLFNTSRAVFNAVVWWVGWMTIYYSLQTLRAFFEPHTLFHTPLSRLVLRIYLCISYLLFQLCSYLPPLHGFRDDIRSHHRDLSRRYSKGILKGKRRETEEIALKPSSEIDTLILERILFTLDEDRTMETFFDAMPGFCDSKLCILPLSSRVQTELRQVLDGFLNRTFLSNFVSESVRASRLITCLDAAHTALEFSAVSGILENIVNGNRDEALPSVEIGHTLRLWRHRQDHDLTVQQIIACIIARAQKRDDRWAMLVKEEFGTPDDVLRNSFTHGDNVLLFILTHISRETIRAGSRTPGILSSLLKFDISKTLPELQHDFCSLWNEIGQAARDQGPSSIPAEILREIRHLYAALHQGTDAAQPLSFPLCDIPSHLPDSTTRVPVADPLTQPGDSPNASLRQSSSPSVDRYSQDGVATAQPDITSAANLYYPAENIEQQSPTTPYMASLADINASGIPPTLPAPTLVETSTTPILNPSFATYEASPALISTSLLPASSSSISGPNSLESPPLPYVQSLRNPEPVSLFSVISPKGPSDNATLLHLHPPKLVSSGNMYLANAVLQSLVYCPPFRELFRDWGRLEGQREGGETSRSVTPLIDATVRLLDEIAYEKSSLMHQAARGKVTEDEVEKKEDSGVDSFPSTDVYDVMKGKRQFTIMRVRSCAHVVVFCLLIRAGLLCLG